MIAFERVTKRYPNGREALSNVTFNINTGEMVFSHRALRRRQEHRVETHRASRATVARHGSREREKHEHAAGAAYSLRFGAILASCSRTTSCSQTAPCLFDNVALPLVVAATPLKEIDKRVRAALDQVGLLGKERMLPFELSVGEQQRVGIARAVISKPPLLIADEPTGNLDPDLALEVMRLFRRFQDVGVTVVVATHDLHIVREFGQREIVLDNGQVQGSATDSLPSVVATR